MKKLMFLAILMMSAPFSFMLFSCASPGTKPDDMSYDQHKQHAENEKVDAAASQKKADNGQDVYYLDGNRQDEFVTGADTVRISPWQERADMDKRHAHEHMVAAAILKKNVVKECSDVKRPDMCPLMSNEKELRSVKKIEKGIKVVFPSGFGESRKAVEQEAVCHVAIGAFVGREGSPGCPLFNKALIITSKDDADGSFTLIITSDDPQSVQGLQAWSDMLNSPRTSNSR